MNPIHLRALSAIAVAAFVAAIGVPIDARDPEVRALWVDSFNPGLRSPAEIDALIERMKRARLNTVIAQVRATRRACSPT